MMVRAIAALVVGLLLVTGVSLPAAAATVKVTVNEVPITDFQIAQRLKLFTLEGKSGQKAATEELIDEALMMQEAKRLNIEVSDSEVENALLNVARNIKVSADKLRQILTANGINVDTLKDRLRASIAWGKVTQSVITPRVQLSELELEQKAAGQIDASKSFDYILKEVVFVMPGGKGNASQRTAEANQFRKNFSSCDTAVQLSQSYTDAAVLDVGRRHATQMPDAIAKELAGLNVGGITKPRVVETGVSMLAVCAKTQAEDLTFVTDQLRQEAGNEALKAEVDTYLAEVKAKARIVYQ